MGRRSVRLRRRLLNDPRLQIPVITAEAASRSTLVKAQIARQQLRAETFGEAQYIKSLRIQCRVERQTAELDQTGTGRRAVFAHDAVQYDRPQILIE